jgi:hypothetical protein
VGAERFVKYQRHSMGPSTNLLPSSQSLISVGIKIPKGIIPQGTDKAQLQIFPLFLSAIFS